jgi:hypothetical protein
MSSETLNLKYKIIEKNDDFYTITVRYWTDIVNEEDLRFSQNNLSDGSPNRCKTDVSIMITSEIKTEEDLHNKILQTAPLVLLQNEQSIKNNNKLDTSFIDVNINKIYEKDIKISDNKKILEDQEIEELLKKFLDN